MAAKEKVRPKQLKKDISEQLDAYCNAKIEQYEDPGHDKAAVDHAHSHGASGQVSLPAAVASAVINFLLMFGLCCAYGMIMFSDDWNSRHRALGVKMNLSTAFIVGLLLSQFSKVPVAIGGPDLNPVVFIGMFVSTISESIATQLGLEYPTSGAKRRLADSASSVVDFCSGDGHLSSACEDYHEQLRATIIFAVAFSSATLGIFYFYLGKYKLTRFVNFIPTGVMEAFLSCVGYKVFLYAIKFCKYQPKQFIPAACIGVPMYFMKAMHIGNPAVVIPLLLLVPLSLFYVGCMFFETDVDEARKNKLYFPEIPNVDFWRIWEDSVFKPNKVNLTAFSRTFLDLALMVMVCLLDCLLKVSSTANKLKIKVDTNYEVKLYGIGNALTTVCGSSVGYMQLKFNVINAGVLGNLKDRRAGAMYAVLCGICFFWSIELINYLPRFFLGALLFFAGSGFVAENLYGSRAYLSFKEWTDVFIILGVFVMSGQLILSVLVGFLITGADFLVKYSKVPCISGRPMRGDELPTRERHSPLLQHSLEHLASKWLVVVKLKGFVFFASAQSMISNTIAEIEAQQELPTYKRLRFVVFDCEQLDGMDASASKAMKKLLDVAEAMNVRILWSHLRPDRVEEWKKRQMLQNDRDWFANLDEALVYVERHILHYRKTKQEAWAALHPSFSLYRDLSRARMRFEPFKNIFTVEAIHYGSPWDYCGRKQLKKHVTLLWEPGDLGRELLLIHSGAVGIFDRIPATEKDKWDPPMKIYRHGWFLNREAMINTPTEHFAVALEDGEVCSWSTKQWFNMVRERPFMASAISNAIMKQEVQDSENVIRRHQEHGSGAPQKPSHRQRRENRSGVIEFISRKSFLHASRPPKEEPSERFGEALPHRPSIINKNLTVWGQKCTHIPEELKTRLAGIQAAQLLDQHGFYAAPPSELRSPRADDSEVCMPSLPGSLQGDLTAVFYKFGVNDGTGYAIPREQVQEALTYSGIFNVIMTDALSPADESLGPKMLNLEEFIAVGQKAFMARLTTHQRTMIQDVFRESDNDGSGGLDVDELDSVLRMAFLPSISIEEVYGIANSWDDDKSGVMEIDEFVAIMSRLIQSHSMNWHLLHGIRQLMGVDECLETDKLTVEMVLKNSDRSLTEVEAEEMLWAADWRNHGNSIDGLELIDVVAAILVEVEVPVGKLPHQRSKRKRRQLSLNPDQREVSEDFSRQGSPYQRQVTDESEFSRQASPHQAPVVPEPALAMIAESLHQLTESPRPTLNVTLLSHATGQSVIPSPPKPAIPTKPSAPNPDVSITVLNPAIMEMVVDMRQWTARMLLDRLTSEACRGEERKSSEVDPPSPTLDLIAKPQANNGFSQSYVALETVESGMTPMSSLTSSTSKDDRSPKKMCKVTLYDILENPDSSGFAKCVSLFMVTVILSSFAALVLEPLISPKDGDGRSEDEEEFWQFAELIFTIIFTVEIVLRVSVADAKGTSTKLGFLRAPTTVCDIAALLPWYIEALVQSDFQALRLLRSFRLIRFARFLRLFRVLKIGKLSKITNNTIFGPISMVLTVIWGIYLKTSADSAKTDFCMSLG